MFSRIFLALPTLGYGNFPQYFGATFAFIHIFQMIKKKKTRQNKILVKVSSDF